MPNTALGHRLETLNDGLTTFANGNRVPMPLIATDIHVQVLAGVAMVKTTRRLRNAEVTPIEVIMTFPVGFDAVVTGLSATIDGRCMVGVAKQKAEARETYETALDEGRLSVLHEEALRGIHVLSVGALPPGAEVSVELEQIIPLTEVSGKQFMRLPMTAGQLYGNSPLLPADDMVTSDAVKHEATLHVVAEEGNVFLEGKALAHNDRKSILLDRAVELVIEGGSFGTLKGRAADGRSVAISFKPMHGHDASIDLHVLVDRSGSTQGLVGAGEVSIWQVMRDGLGDVLRTMRPSDQISLWQFDNDCQFLGTARGEACSTLVGKLQGPQGGTELAGAVRAAILAGAKDLLVLTDGQTWAHIVDELKSESVRISAIFVGAGSLDANVGHLCAITGGQVLYAPNQDVTSPLRSMFEALRTPGAAVFGQIGEPGPEQVTALRGGITIIAKWSTELHTQETARTEALGRFAAALAIPLLDAEGGEAWARAHGLSTHSTSLVLVDEAGQVTTGFSQMRKVATMHVAQRVVYDCESAPMRSITRKTISAAKLQKFPVSEKDVLMHPSDGIISRARAAIKEFINGRSEQPRSAQPKNEIAWVMEKRRGREQNQLHKIFQGYEWDRHGDALLLGDFSSLDLSQETEVRQMVQALRKLRAENASAIDEDVLRIYALGLIARKTGDRYAARFERRALNGAPDWVAHSA